MVPSGFTVKTLHAFRCRYMCHVRCPSHPKFYYPHTIVVRNKFRDHSALLSSLQCSLNPKYLSQHPALEHPQPMFFNTKQKENHSPYILVSLFRQLMCRCRDSTECQHTFPEFNMPLFSQCMQFRFVSFVSKYLNLALKRLYCSLYDVFFILLMPEHNICFSQHLLLANFLRNNN